MVESAKVRRISHEGHQDGLLEDLDRRVLDYFGIANPHNNTTIEEYYSDTEDNDDGNIDHETLVEDLKYIRTRKHYRADAED